jgi:hypothetical protein
MTHSGRFVPGVLKKHGGKWDDGYYAIGLSLDEEPLEKRRYTKSRLTIP